MSVKTSKTDADLELIQIAREFRDGILDGQGPDSMCFAVCAPLEGFLSFGGYSVELEELDFQWANHYILRLPDGRILDPTIAQFADHMPIESDCYLGHMPEQFVAWMDKGQRGAAR